MIISCAGHVSLRGLDAKTPLQLYREGALLVRSAFLKRRAEAGFLRLRDFPCGWGEFLLVVGLQRISDSALLHPAVLCTRGHAWTQGVYLA